MFVFAEGVIFIAAYKWVGLINEAYVKYLCKNLEVKEGRGLLLGGYSNIWTSAFFDYYLVSNSQFLFASSNNVYRLNKWPSPLYSKNPILLHINNALNKHTKSHTVSYNLYNVPRHDPGKLTQQ